MPAAEVGIVRLGNTRDSPSVSNSRKETVMTAGSVRTPGPLAVHMDALHDWLGRTGCSAERSVRCEYAFARLSGWMADRHLQLADLDGDAIGEYIRCEQERIGSTTPSAFQYLPIARRYLAEVGVLAPAPPVGADWEQRFPASCGQPRSGAVIVPAQEVLTCGNVLEQRFCPPARSVRDEEAFGSSSQLCTARLRCLN